MWCLETHTQIANNWAPLISPSFSPEPVFILGYCRTMRVVVILVTWWERSWSLCRETRYFFVSMCHVHDKWKKPFYFFFTHWTGPNCSSTQSVLALWLSSLYNIKSIFLVFFSELVMWLCCTPDIKKITTSLHFKKNHLRSLKTAVVSSDNIGDVTTGNSLKPKRFIVMKSQLLASGSL